MVAGIDEIINQFHSPLLRMVVECQAVRHHAHCQRLAAFRPSACGNKNYCIELTSKHVGVVELKIVSLIGAAGNVSILNLQ